MTVRLIAAAGGLAAALTLAACGSDNTSISTGAKAGGGSGSGSTSAAGGSSSGSGSSGINCKSSGTLTASGSTAQANAMSDWVKAFQQACSGTTINYAGGGSGKGVTDFTSGTVDFAGSDFPLDSTQKPGADKRCNGSAIDLPMVPGPIAIGYNLPGVTGLNLSAKTLADIFSGKVSKWNDLEIKQDNSGANLPSIGIQTFHRSDGSGTTFNFTSYLESDAGSAWTFGHDKAWKAPGGQGSKGTAGIAQGVKSTPGGIGYMELSYAKNSNIPYAKVGNAQGKFIELTTSNVQAFLAHAQPAPGASGNDIPLKFDYTNSDENAYPAVLVTYEIACQSGNKRAQLLKSFFSYLAGDGQSILEKDAYVPLPSSLQSKVQSAVNSIS